MSANDKAGPVQQKATPPVAHRPHRGADSKPQSPEMLLAGPAVEPLRGGAMMVWSGA